MKYTHVTSKLTEDAVKKIAELTNLSGMLNGVLAKNEQKIKE
jgi:hypothetical protein